MLMLYSGLSSFRKFSTTKRNFQVVVLILCLSSRDLSISKKTWNRCYCWTSDYKILERPAEPTLLEPGLSIKYGSLKIPATSFGVFCNWNPERLGTRQTENKDTGHWSTSCVSAIKAHWSNSCGLSRTRVFNTSLCWLMTLSARLTLSNAKKTLFGRPYWLTDTQV
jgi:hypothetical protein